MIGRLSNVVLDCPDPPALARFYSELLGWPVTRVDADWIDIGDGTEPKLSFQLAPDHVPPRWPDPGHPQQFHLDIVVEDIEAATSAAVALGATPLPVLEPEAPLPGVRRSGRPPVLSVLVSGGVSR